MRSKVYRRVSGLALSLAAIGCGPGVGHPAKPAAAIETRAATQQDTATEVEPTPELAGSESARCEGAASNVQFRVVGTIPQAAKFRSELGDRAVAFDREGKAWLIQASGVEPSPELSSYAQKKATVRTVYATAADGLMGEGRVSVPAPGYGMAIEMEMPASFRFAGERWVMEEASRTYGSRKEPMDPQINAAFGGATSMYPVGTLADGRVLGILLDQLYVLRPNGRPLAKPTSECGNTEKFYGGEVHEGVPYAVRGGCTGAAELIRWNQMTSSSLVRTIPEHVHLLLSVDRGELYMGGSDFASGRGYVAIVRGDEPLETEPFELEAGNVAGQLRWQVVPDGWGVAAQQLEQANKEAKALVHAVYLFPNGTTAPIVRRFEPADVVHMANGYVWVRYNGEDGALGEVCVIRPNAQRPQTVVAPSVDDAGWKVERFGVLGDGTAIVYATHSSSARETTVLMSVPMDPVARPASPAL